MKTLLGILINIVWIATVWFLNNGYPQLEGLLNILNTVYLTLIVVVGLSIVGIPEMAAKDPTKFMCFIIKHNEIYSFWSKVRNALFYGIITPLVVWYEMWGTLFVLLLGVIVFGVYCLVMKATEDALAKLEGKL